MKNDKIVAWVKLKIIHNENEEPKIEFNSKKDIWFENENNEWEKITELFTEKKHKQVYWLPILKTIDKRDFNKWQKCLISVFFIEENEELDFYDFKILMQRNL